MGRLTVLSALPLAAALFLSTAGSALMADVERPFCTADEGRLWASYTFDDAQSPPLVTTITVFNQTLTAKQLTAQVLDPNTDEVILQRSVVARLGQRTFNIQNADVRMIDRVARDGSHYWGLPYTVACQIG